MIPDMYATKDDPTEPREPTRYPSSLDFHTSFCAMMYITAKPLEMMEFNSLSKTYNLTGARLSFLLGNKAILERYRALRTQIDYGLFYVAQRAAIAALDGPQEGVVRQRAEYQRRRDALCGGFRSIGWDVPDSHGSMFVWAPVPQGHGTSMEFCMEMIEKAGVICTPGSSFGPSGEGYVRFALTLPVEKITEAVQAVKNSGLIG